MRSLLLSDAALLARPYIASAPDFIYSIVVLVDGLGRCRGSLIWQRLGTHQLADGEVYRPTTA